MEQNYWMMEQYIVTMEQNVLYIIMEQYVFNDGTVRM